MTTPDLLAFSTGTQFATYYSTLTIAPEKALEFHDLHRLHQLVLNGFGAAENGPLSRRVLFAVGRAEAVVLRGSQKRQAGEPLRILTQSPMPGKWQPLIDAGILTRATTDDIQQKWDDGDFAQIRMMASPMRRVKRRVEYPLRTDTECGEWLVRQLARGGFTVDPGTIGVTIGEHAYGRSKSDETEKAIHHVGRTFSAYGQVENASAFIDMLHAGVGRGKSYGYGLLQARRVTK